MATAMPGTFQKRSVSARMASTPAASQVSAARRETGTETTRRNARQARKPAPRIEPRLMVGSLTDNGATVSRLSAERRRFGFAPLPRGATIDIMRNTNLPSSSPQVTFYGAAQSVTGSMHLVQVGDLKI